MITFARLLLLLLPLFLLPAPASMAAAPPAIEDFFDRPAFSGALLSPDARSLAVQVGGKTGRVRLAVMDLASRDIKVVASFADVDIDNFQWVNNERIAFDTGNRDKAQLDTEDGPGLYAVNRDGSALRQLVSRHGNGLVEQRNMQLRQMLPWNTYLHEQAGPADSPFIYATQPKWDKNWDVEFVKLLKIDTTTGSSTVVAPPPLARQWLLDNKGEPRFVISIDKNLEIMYYRDPATDSWRKLGEFDAYKGSKDAFDPLAFGPAGTLYATSRIGRDTAALHTVNLATGQLSKEALVALAGYDYSGTLVMNKDKLLGVQYLTDARSSLWFDPAMKALQQTVDALLPATVNLMSIGARATTPWILLDSYSDVQPHTYSLFNPDTRELIKVGDTHANINPARMGNQELVHYKTKDGLTIPAWLTLPQGIGHKDLPLVVMVHGGPYLRGNEWGWDREAQFLASRGYAVLAPEFRGSTGFGDKHYRAGWKQWGLAMQDDIADGARWAIAQGIANPKRICIAGASYGGYATLMGLVNNPELYRCGINWVGVTDIKLMYTLAWSPESDMSMGWRQYGMPDLIGDPVKDAAQLAATSPIQQAARIKQPLLLAYGGADRRVPLAHGKQFYEAVKAGGNQQVEWVLYPEEGHGWYLPQTRIDFWGRVETFLNQHIGKP